MSFGFSVSDFFTLAQFAWNVYISCKDSPKDFQDIAEQVNTLNVLLQSTAECLTQHPQESKEVAQLSSLKTGCHDTLTEIDRLLRKHGTLGTKKPRKWHMMRWAATRDARQVKSKLLFHATALAALNAALSQHSQLRVEDLLNRNAGKDGTNSDTDPASSSTPPTLLPERDNVTEKMTHSDTLIGDFSSSSYNSPFTPCTTDSDSGPSILDSAEQASAGHVYQGVTAADKCTQINGNISTANPSSPTPRHHYRNIMASGESFQLNGNVSQEAFQRLIQVH